MISVAIPEHAAGASEPKASETEILSEQPAPAKNSKKIKEEAVKATRSEAPKTNQSDTQKPNRPSRHNEKRPPAWTGGNNFDDPETIPAFLR